MDTNILTAYLTRAGVFIKKKEFIKTFGLETFIKLQKKLYIKTIVDRFRNVIRTSNLLEYHKKNDYLILPRFTGFELEAQNYIKIINQIKFPTLIESEIDEIIAEPTKNQLVIMDYLMKNIYNKERIDKGNAGCVLHLAAGQGKTYVGGMLIDEIQKILNRKLKVMIIVPKETLLNQTKRVMELIFPTLKIGMYYNKIKCINDINIMIIDSALSEEFYYYEDCFINTSSDIDSEKPYSITIPENPDYEINATKRAKIYKQYGGSIKYKELHNKDPETFPNIFDRTIKLKLTTKSFSDFYKQFDIIMYDEVHEYCCNKIKKVFRRAQAPIVLGLTATPYSRKDRFDLMLKEFVGPIITASEITGYDGGQFDFTSTLNVIKYKTHIDYSNHYEIHNDTLNQLIDDPYRNQLIMDLIKTNIEKNRNTYVFTERRRHAILLKKIYNIQFSDSLCDSDSHSDTNSQGEFENELAEDDENESEILDDEVNSQDENELDDEFEKQLNAESLNDSIDDEFEKQLNSNPDIDSEWLTDTPQNNSKNTSNNISNIDILMGGVSASSELHIEKTAKIIIATYQYLGTGKSIAKMDSIIFALPRKAQMEQIAGRIFRLNGDSSIHREIYDIVDQNLSIKSQHYHRKKIIIDKYNSDVNYLSTVNYTNIIFPKNCNLKTISKIIKESHK
jgi:hypothetical protein